MYTVMSMLGLVSFCSKPFFVQDVGAPFVYPLYTWWDVFLTLSFFFSMNLCCLFIKKKKKTLIIFFGILFVFCLFLGGGCLLFVPMGT